MNIAKLAARNLSRNKFRTVATALGVALAVLTFVLMRTVVTAWSDVSDRAAPDRVATRHKVSFAMGLPLRYVDSIKQVPGVEHVVAAMWFGGKHPVRERDFFGTIAVQPEAFFQVYNELDVPEQQKQSWFQNRRGAIVGRITAKKFGWKVGDRIQLAGTIYPGDFGHVLFPLGLLERKRRSAVEGSSRLGGCAH